MNEKEAPDGWVYAEVRKGMYVLPQARLLVQELLEERLAKNGYKQSKLMPGLRKQHTNPMQILALNIVGKKMHRI